jgi:hypothetical protein
MLILQSIYDYMDTSIKKIISDIDDINKILVNRQNNNELLLIERDIILSKLQTVYVEVSKLNTTSQSNKIDTPVEQIAELLQQKKPFEAQKKKAAPKSANQNEPIKTKEKKTDETSYFLEIENIEQPVIKAEIIENEDIVVKQVQEKKTIADKFQKAEPLINELLAMQASKKDLSSLMQSKPLKDIESAIGVNERFVFVKELFNGDTETYLKTLKILNNAHNFNDAFNYLNQTFSWDFESDPAHKLLDLVRRRHIVDLE